MNRSALIALVLTVSTAPAFGQQTPTISGFDTTSINMPLVFANGGQQVGVWSTSALVVSGGVQIGQNTSVCQPSMAGQVRWNPSTAALELCSASVWQPSGFVPPGTLCGSVFVAYLNGGCAGNIQNKATCQGVTLANSCGPIQCPAGYAPAQIAYSWGISNGMYQYMQYSCAKQ
jgi:hypothetical protein